MIVDGLVALLLGIVQPILTAVLPVSAGPDTGSVTGLVHWYAWFNGWLPLAETFDLAVTSVEVLVVLAGVWAVVWVLRRLPFGIGGT